MKKCPYLSTKLECYAGHIGTVNCMHEAFHNDCAHKLKAVEKLKPEFKIINNGPN